MTTQKEVETEIDKEIRRLLLGEEITPEELPVFTKALLARMSMKLCLKVFSLPSYINWLKKHIDVKEIIVKDDEIKIILGEPESVKGKEFLCTCPKCDHVDKIDEFAFANSGTGGDVWLSTECPKCHHTWLDD